MSSPDLNFIRLPESGHLHITNYKEFLNESKKKFQERWRKIITYKENLGDFDIINHLGNGSFGCVVLVKYRKNDEFYAMKIIEKESIVRNNQVEYLKNEKKVLQCTNFPFMCYLDCCFQNNSYVFLVIPYMPFELFNLLEQFKHLSETHARFYISQVVLAIEYLHYLELIYRDLKPENILIDAAGFIKLTDFGFCKLMRGKRTFTVCGTPEYIAPEVLLNKGYGFAVDWWGCGILMYELVAGTTPFHARTTLKTCSNVLTCKYKIPSHFSPELRDLVENILTADLTKRYGNLKNGASEIKHHKWFKTVNWMAILNRTASVPYTPPHRPERKRDNWTLPTSAVTDRYSVLFEEF